jgi:succinoglycan biosynthesis transport protein ExoP
VEFDTVRQSSPSIGQFEWHTIPSEFRPAADPGIFDNRSPALKDYWLTLRKHLGLVIAALITSVFVTFLIVFTMTPIYTAEATILIEPNDPQVLDIKQVISDTFDQDSDDYFKTQYELLKSRRLAAEVVRQENLATDPMFAGEQARAAARTGLVTGLLGTFRSEFAGPAAPSSNTAEIRIDADETLPGVPSSLVSAYLSRLQVKPEPGTRLVKVSYSSPSPVLSARLANAHAAAFIHRGLELHSEANEEAQRFLQAKLTELRERVENSETALNAYRRDKGILPLGDKQDLVIQRLDQLSRDLMSAESARISLEAQQKLIHKGEFDSLPSVANSILIQQLKSSLSQLESEYVSLSARFNAGYPRLDELQAQADETRRHLGEEVSKAVEASRSAYAAAVAKEKTLRERVEQQKALAFGEKDSGVQAAILAREVDTNKQLYDSVLQRMKETGVAAQVRASNVFIVDRAEPPHSPAKPRRRLDLLLSVLVGLAAGVGLPFFLESLDDTLSNPEKVERYLRLPNLALVPDFTRLNGAGLPPAVSSIFLKKTRRKARQVADGSQTHHRDLVVGEGRLSGVAEAYRTLRSALLLSRAGEPPRATLITSAINSEGKTVTAANLAASFAQMHLSVLVVDADLRRPRCHRIFNLQNDVGLTEILTGMADISAVIAKTTMPQLDLLKAGSQPPNPSELLGSRKMRETLDSLRSRYEFIVIDSAPIMLVSDALTLSTIVDGTLVVVNSSQTAKNLVRMACARLEFVGAKILGVALNLVDITGPEYYYKDYYYSYRHHAYYQDEPDNRVQNGLVSSQ